MERRDRQARALLETAHMFRKKILSFLHSFGLSLFCMFRREKFGKETWLFSRLKTYFGVKEILPSGGKP
jgi:hypothetical protein